MNIGYVKSIQIQITPNRSPARATPSPSLGQKNQDYAAPVAISGQYRPPKDHFQPILPPSVRVNHGQIEDLS